MNPTLLTILQGACGVACIVLSVVFLADPKYLAAYTAVSGFGFSLLGNVFTGPNQISRAKADEMVRAASIRPPSE